MGSGHTLAFDPETDVWRELDPSPEVGDFMVATDDGLVFVAYDQRPSADPVDWLLDPETGHWSGLPRDPFGESYDRSMAWDGEQLWLVSMAVKNHFAAYEGAPSRLAVLEGDRWRVVEGETPPVRYEQDAWWVKDQIVVAAGSFGDQTHTYDTATHEWTTLPTAEDGPCPIPPAGAGPTWLSGGGPNLISIAPQMSLPIPACPEMNRRGSSGPDVALWAGSALVVWGYDFKRDAALGILWQPPPPT